MTCRIEELIGELESGRDVLQVCEKLQVTHAQALKMLEGRRGRRLVAGRGRLARIAGMLLAQRFGPHAIQRLCHLLSDEKVEVQMKGIAMLLGVVGWNGKRRNRKANKGRGRGKGLAAGVGEPSAEDGEVLEALAEVLTGKRAGSGEREKAP